MKSKTRYTMVDKRGREIYYSDSFWGFIGTTILVQLLGTLFILIGGVILSGIASLFN